MAEETNNANVTKIDVSVPLEATMGASPSMRNLREKQGLTKSDFSFKIPTQQDACMHVNEEHGRHSWQAKILNVIHTKGFQRFMIGLLLADVLILFTELFLMATVCFCFIVLRKIAVLFDYKDIPHIPFYLFSFLIVPLWNAMPSLVVQSTKRTKDVG